MCGLNMESSLYTCLVHVSTSFTNNKANLCCKTTFIKARDEGRYFSKVTSYLLLTTSHNITRYSYKLL